MMDALEELQLEVLEKENKRMKEVSNNNTLLLKYLRKCDELKKVEDRCKCCPTQYGKPKVTEVPRHEGRRIAKELEDYGVFGTPPLKGLNNLLPREASKLFSYQPIIDPAPKVRVDYEEGGNHD